MKPFKKILLLFAFFFMSFEAWGQSTVDTLAFLTISNTYLKDASTLEFDLKIRRNSFVWERLANGTFEFTFDTLKYNFDKNKITIDAFDTGLKRGIVSGGGQLPVGGYSMKTECFPGRIALTIIGPGTFEDCNVIPMDSSLLMAKIEIKSIDGSPLPDTVYWSQPVQYFQAVAYKTDKDSIVEDFVKIYTPDDNIEIRDNADKYVSFSIENQKYGTVLDTFIVDYIGDRKMRIQWKMKSEYFNSGFTLRRAEQLDPTTPDEQLDYSNIIATYKPGDKFRTEMIGKGNTQIPVWYDPIFDTVQYRGVTYCYKLYYDQVYPNENRTVDSLIGKRCREVPNAVISFSQVNPNPFKTNTDLSFIVDDDVYLTIMVVDLLGRVVQTICDKKRVGVGSYGKMFGNDLPGVDLVFRPGPYASNMLFDIIFIAYPINDPSIEISRAVNKVTLIR